jgi:hypothetical protein
LPKPKFKQKKAMSREQQIAEAYCKLLNSIDWSDKLLVAGLREGLNKFLSNAFLSLFPKCHKYHRTHLVSAAALRQLRAKEYAGLVCEHIVPKTRYIQKRCEEAAKKGRLTVHDVRDLLDKYWRLATITKEEDRRLNPVSMPETWDGVNPLARYEAAGIELLPNPFYHDLEDSDPARAGRKGDELR